ncbi:membrane protein [Luteitalea sp. TBR-22]|uniref:3-keto-disaccharide hydrolase n=1 Tax=Luteitalea sp. TBR-22 TaxID=2802971 RepID=UPI001AF46CDB|nr:DUF1080 domain-containing protein [Luteitalea sp. TBR-22]BCS32147.1 membrane protein [Luteitalea sp. TBR-22]
MRPLLALAFGLLIPTVAAAQSRPEWTPLFNGKDLTGWTNINTDPDTWFVKDGMLMTTGKPLGVMCSDKMYENFVLHIEWMHHEAGGNSGVFIWSAARPSPEGRLPDGLEVQMLEVDWPKLHVKDGVMPTDDYVHGELFGVGGVQIIPDNPRGPRSKSIEKRALPRENWNVYDLVAVDGVAKLSVNGKFVNGIRNSSRRKGYLCMEAEGAPIQWRNAWIMELPGGVTTPDMIAPERGK